MLIRKYLVVVIPDIKAIPDVPIRSKREMYIKVIKIIHKLDNSADQIVPTCALKYESQQMNQVHFSNVKNANTLWQDTDRIQDKPLEDIVHFNNHTSIDREQLNSSYIIKCM